VSDHRQHPDRSPADIQARPTPFSGSQRAAVMPPTKHFNASRRWAWFEFVPLTAPCRTLVVRSRRCPQNSWRRWAVVVSEGLGGSLMDCRCSTDPSIPRVKHRGGHQTRTHLGSPRRRTPCTCASVPRIFPDSSRCRAHDCPPRSPPSQYVAVAVRPVTDRDQRRQRHRPRGPDLLVSMVDPR